MKLILIPIIRTVEVLLCIVAFVFAFIFMFILQFLWEFKIDVAMSFIQRFRKGENVFYGDGDLIKTPWMINKSGRYGSYQDRSNPDKIYKNVWYYIINKPISEQKECLKK